MTTYYVATAGSDGANGQTPATAWKTLGKAQSTAVADDVVLLNRGDRWRETFTPPARMTLGAYGADPVADADGYVTNAPIIDGGEFVTGWSAYSGGAPYEYAKDDFAGTAGADLSASTMEIGGPWVKQSTFSGTNTLILTAAGTVRRGTTGLVVYYATASPPSADYAVEADFLVKSLLTTDPSRLAARTDTVAQTQYTLGIDPAGQLAFSKFVAGAGTSLLNVPFTWNVGQTYKLRLEVEGDTLRGYVDGVLMGTVTDSAIFSAGKAGLRLGGGSAPAPSDTTGIHVDNFRVFPIGAGGTPTNTYQATLAAEAKLVELRSAYSPNGSSPDTLADGQFYWVGGKLYVRSNIGAPGNTDVVAGQRNNAIVGGTLSDLTIQDVAIEHANDRSIVFTGGARAVLRRVMIQRSSGGTGQNGTVAFAPHASPLMQDCVIRNCGSDGVYCNAVTDPVFDGNRIGPVYGPNADGLQVDSADGTVVNSRITNNYFTQTGTTSPKGSVILFGDQHLVEDNYIEGGNNFGVSCPGSHFVIRGNRFFKTGPGGAVRIMDNPPGIALDDHVVDHNLMVDCLVGILVGSGGTQNRTRQRYVANTIVNYTVAPVRQVDMQQAVSGEFTDNILWSTIAGDAMKLTSVVSGKTWTSDYNLIGPARTGYISHLGVLYDTLAAYQSATGRDTHSVEGDPLFVGPTGTTDPAAYVLAAASPAAGAGAVSLGLIEDAPVNIGAFAAEVVVVPPELSPMRPTVAEVSILERTRTVGEHSGGLGGDTSASDVTVFGPLTRPTAGEVELVIDQAYDLVIGRLPPTIPEAYVGAVRSLMALQAAILIETSFFRESLDEGSVEAYTAMLTAGLPRLTEAIDEEVTETTIGGFASVPVRSATVAAAYPVEIP